MCFIIYTTGYVTPTSSKPGNQHYICRVSTTPGTPGNPGNLLEFTGPPGNLCVR